MKTSILLQLITCTLMIIFNQPVNAQMSQNRNNWVIGLVSNQGYNFKLPSQKANNNNKKEVTTTRYNTVAIITNQSNVFNQQPREILPAANSKQPSVAFNGLTPVNQLGNDIQKDISERKLKNDVSAPVIVSSEKVIRTSVIY